MEAAKCIAEATNATLFEILPKKKVKNEFIVDMEEGNVIIEDIRALYERTRTRQTGKHIYVMDTGLKSMTLGAQNAFLKLLEEPRPNVHFIIATHRSDLLLPTIISRCQKLSLLPITPLQTKDFIAKWKIADPVKTARLAFVASGLPALATRLIQDENAYEARVAIMSDAKTLLSGSPDEKLTVIHKYRDSRPDSLTLLNDMNHQLKTVIASRPDVRLAAAIDAYLDAHSNIANGGNIRLQLTAAVL